MNTRGKKISATIRRKYGDDFWSKIGTKGGASHDGHNSGFGINPKTAVSAGHLGGKNSKRGFKLIKKTPYYLTYIRTSDGQKIRINRWLSHD